jgi:hypothetical protein
MNKSIKIMIAFLMAIGLTGVTGIANAGQSPSSSTTAFSGVTAKAPKNSSQTFSGTGDDVVRVKAVSATVLVTFTHDGESNFIVTSKTKNDDYIDGLVNVIGPYSGTVIQELGTSFFNKEKLGLFEVQADGDWTIKIKPLSKAKKWNGKTLSGTGDLVVKVPKKTRPGNRFVMKHVGDSNFIVITHNSKGKYLDLKANEIGDYSGRVTFGKSTYIAIQTQGDWTLKRK